MGLNGVFMEENYLFNYFTITNKYVQTYTKNRKKVKRCHENCEKIGVELLVMNG